MSNTPEQNKVAELMKPRYKVIADYPQSCFSAGEILEFDGIETAGIGHHLSGVFVRGVNKPDKYPHLFKKMEWWEDRKPEEIEFIEHLKVLSTGDIMRTSDLVSGVYKNHLMNYQPATQSEYDQYIKQKL